jgi:uncharacterized FlaG/YvyC family protein
MIPLSDNMITPSGKLSLYLYSQSSQIILMYKQTNTTSQSNESAGGREMLESEKAIQRCHDDLEKINKDIQRKMRQELNWAEKRMDSTIQHLETQLKIWNKDLK